MKLTSSIECALTIHVDLSDVPRAFFGILAHISTMFLGGSEGPPPWLTAFSEKFLEFRIFRLA